MQRGEKKMHIIKRIIHVGTSKAVIIPCEWLGWMKRKHGIEPKEVVLEINNDSIVIRPHFGTVEINKN